MSAETKQLLEHFASNIHWGAFGNPEDLDRFFDFIISAYQNGDYAIPFDSFSSIIDSCAENKGPGSDKQFISKKIAFTMLMFDKYRDGIILLSKFNANIDNQ